MGEGGSLRKFYFSSCKLFQMAQLSDISISLLPPLIIPTGCSYRYHPEMVQRGIYRLLTLTLMRLVIIEININIFAIF
jgi:hypothetical protein